MGSDRAFVKLDFSNAFNSLRRDALLDAVSRHHPDLLDFALSSYGAASELWVGETVLSSAEGVQQGDPLGPLFFCLALDAPLKSVNPEFITGYLDDVGLGDTIPRLIDNIRVLEGAAAAIGLNLNHAKCEIVGLDREHRELWEAGGSTSSSALQRRLFFWALPFLFRAPLRPSETVGCNWRRGRTGCSSFRRTRLSLS
jgi:hypothetical protein